MKIVDPIKDIKNINAMKSYLKKRNLRHYVLFTMGINCALNITDLLSIRWENVLNEDKKTFKNIQITEKKSGKSKEIKINKSLQLALTSLLKTFDNVDLDEYIFKSREGINRPITRQCALNILKNAAKEIGLSENIGANSLRKTWGYHAFKNGFNPHLVMKTLNHERLNFTKKYIDIGYDEIDEIYSKITL